MIMPILSIKASKSPNVSNAIAYVLDREKSTLSATLNLNSNEDYAVQMNRTARMWRKDKQNSRTFYHAKLAFHPDDSDRNGGPLTGWMANNIAIRLCREFFDGYQAVLSVHSDKHHKHVHIIISAVHPLTGKKLNLRNEAYRQMKDRANEIAAEHGLSTIDWRAAVRNKRNGGERLPEDPDSYSFAERGMAQRGKDIWKDELRIKITGAVIGCRDLDDFRRNLEVEGVSLTRCTDHSITYKYKDHPPVRGDTLGGDYTMASIQNTIKCYQEWPDRYDIIDEKDAELYLSLGRFAGIRRSEIQAITEELPHATWDQKKEVWAEYRELKESFWTSWKKRRDGLKAEMDEAYRHRRLIKDAQWLLDPRNKRRCLAGIVFAAIILHKYGDRGEIELRIRNLRSQMELLRSESVEFRAQSEAAILNLRQRELTLEQYLAEVRKMQELAEGMFEQPTQEMAILWAIEHNARVKAPTLAEYIEMCEKDRDFIAEEVKESEKMS